MSKIISTVAKFQVPCARFICFSARSSLYTSSDALAKYKDGFSVICIPSNDSNSKQFLKHRILQEADLLGPLTGEHRSSASLRP